jgi:cytochrome c oxidase assembly factor CtaG
MLGLAVLFFIGLYLLITLAAVWFAARWASKRGRRAWVWGAVAAFVMYNLVFSCTHCSGVL